MLSRRLEPEVMDTLADARDYDAMDHSTVNRVFVDDLLAYCRGTSLGPRRADSANPLATLDVGTGTALIPIELCRRLVACRVTAIDAATEMLKIAASNITRAGFADRIAAQCLDAKRMPFVTGTFDCVMSNSIVHHIPEPRDVMREMVRVLAPGGVLFVRDLLRPDSEAEVEWRVATYAGNENAHSQQLFRDSLYAALTLDEVRVLAGEFAVPASAVQQTSDRHWTLAWSTSRPSIPRTTSRELLFQNGTAIGISNRWHQGQYCSILTSAGIVGCGIYDLQTPAEFGQAIAICKGTPANPLTEPEDLFESRIVGCTPKAESFGIRIGMTGREAVELMLQASR